MPKRRLALAAACAALVAGPAAAQTCDVFTDVVSGTATCNAVQWLKNRAITSGCTATEYCPNNPVTRAQMALFLNRLGTPITPVIRHVETVIPGTSVSPGQWQSMCNLQPGTIGTAAYPRSAWARASVSITLSGANADVFIAAGKNGGPYVSLNAQHLRIPAPNGWRFVAWSTQAGQADAELQPNDEYEFAIGVANPAGAAGPLTISGGQCQLDVVLTNRNGTAAPFDE